MIPQPVPWPEIKIAGKTYTLRFSYASRYQLASWGVKTFAEATNVQLAAVMAGRFDDAGQWHSAGFASGLALADLMEDSDEMPLLEGVAAALKKARPEAEFQIQPVPETASTAAVTDSSNSGPSLSLAAGSD